MRTLRTALLPLAVALLLGSCSQYSKIAKNSASAAAVTAEQKALSRSVERFAGQPRVKLAHLLAAADTARLQLATKPTNALARSDYNFAVSRVMEVVNDAGFSPWEAPIHCSAEGAGSWNLRLTPPDPRPEYHPSNFKFQPADRLDFKGKLVGQRSIKQGLGAPIVVTGKDLDFTKIDQFAQGKQIYYGLSALVRFDGPDCELVLVDPLEQETVRLDDHTYPVGADFQAPLALSLAELSSKKGDLAGLFKPDEFERSARLARLQPYNPDKTPVLFIHGLGDSRATWMPLIDMLRADPLIRQHYQFWVFNYASGLPYPISAAILRHQLDQFSARYPDHKDIVVVGHSMGAMIARLLISDSGMTFWDAIYSAPPDQIPFSAETRRVLTKSLIFEARPNIARVIYASGSHRGSDKATNFFGRLGAKMIGDPISESLVNKEAVAYARPNSDGSPKRDRLPNAIDVLDPENRFLKLADTLTPTPGVPYHSIIGDRGKGGNLDHTKPVSSDGIVPYWSSHLDGATSETIVPSGHWTIHHPRGMAEIQHILIEAVHQD